ncbi:hypothetical protein [Streptomyces hydrogenans]|uniref:hypothetical protein n=1 Tax=Streptomyces hydrogenans TaxID=1873719 RepID=UPI003817444C
MKRTDLKPGALYAYRASQYDRPAIARLVEADRLWTKNRVQGDNGQTLNVWAPSRETTAKKARAHFEHGSGYLALFTRDTTKAEALASIPLPDTLTSDTVTALEVALPADVTLLTLNNRTLTGDWATEYAAYEAEQTAQENARQRRQPQQPRPVRTARRTAHRPRPHRRPVRGRRHRDHAA